MVSQSGSPPHVQAVSGLIQPPALASAAAFDHAGMMPMLLGQGMQYHVMLAVLAHREDQTEIGPFNSHEKGLPEVGQKDESQSGNHRGYPAEQQHVIGPMPVRVGATPPYDSEQRHGTSAKQNHTPTI
jgi:hypothetical protein